MKKVFIIFILVFFLRLDLRATGPANGSFRGPVDTLPTAQLISLLQQMNVSSFYGLPVDSFILSIDAIPYNMKVYGGSHSKWQSQRASYLWYQYSGGPIIRIYVKDYVYLNRYSPTTSWDVNLFRKEKIYRIDIYKDQNSCINGSCKE